MYKMCKTEQSAARQRQLELGLQKILLTRRYEDVSISDLCQSLQIPRKSFYRYFSSKDGALYALIDHTMLEFYEGSLRSNAGGTHMGDLTRFFAFWSHNRQVLDALQYSGLSGILVERAKMMAENERLMPGLIKEWGPQVQRLAMSFVICGLMAMVIQWHHEGFQVSPEEIAQVATNLLTRPMLQR